MMRMPFDYDKNVSPKMRPVVGVLDHGNPEPCRA